MGVYIPTWKKPDDCLRCPFHRAYEDGTISCELPESSPDDCKMVDVKTPHGGLIDADELLNKFADKEVHISDTWQFHQIKNNINNTEIVIERED